MQYITVVIGFPDTAQSPKFTANMELLGGNVVGVQFSDLLSENEKMRDAICSDSPVRLAALGDIGAAAVYEKDMAEAAGIVMIRPPTLPASPSSPKGDNVFTPMLLSGN